MNEQREVFYGSLCYQGIRGGAIALTKEAVLYKNQTVTMPDHLKNIVIPYSSITKVKPGFYGFFPSVTIFLDNKKSYQLIVFQRKRFLHSLRNYGVIQP